MDGTIDAMLHSFQTHTFDRSPGLPPSAIRHDRPEPPRAGVLPVALLFAFGLAMVVMTQWMHPAGPIEDPLITQEQNLF